ncbi:hypothetical protein PHSY_002759 [Pseudozyma hubeiensis SY62]|uniref:Uncharacterized protein n=1 Tax=Pseudozyma hubeiensis (strain SY62) TaxID=1305764 RepID=R9P1U4_PSEHS|nr:hypothetical protein PHSY_002759 [Pseudozyma hubeiensis SY62]GAC95184.1 hypothetical protein PHSY_002759 [Pseudozyma hubeiensis SY62]
MTTSPQFDSQRAVVALLNQASTVHRLSILDHLVDTKSSPFQLVAERSLCLSLPEDDDLLRSLLAHEISTQGEAETLVRWALKFTAATSFFIVLEMKHATQDSAVEVLLRDFAPNLWETYGQDEIYVSPDCATAEMQIELLFPHGLDSDTTAVTDSTHTLSLASPVEHAPPMVPNASSSSAAESAFSYTSAASTSTAATSVRPQSRASSAHPTFKARPIPTTVKSAPSIQPRLSKAAALRMGVQLPDSPARVASRNVSPTKDSASVGISGVVKRPVAPPVSLKAPSIAPRLNKAAMARQGGPSAAAPELAGRPASAAAGATRHAFPTTLSTSADAAPRKQVDFSNTPGHKRHSLIGKTTIASIAPPTIAPRQNRASMSRIQPQTLATASSRPTSRDAASAPPSSFKGASLARRSSVSTPQSAAHRDRAPVDFTATPGHKRTSLSLSIPSLAAPSLAPRQNRASLARTQQPSGTASPRLTEKSPAVKATDFTAVAGHKRSSLSFSLSSLRAPSIEPRLNRAAGVRMGMGKGAAGQ